MLADEIRRSGFLELQQVVAKVMTTMALITVGCRSSREPWELVPLNEGQVEVTRLRTGTEVQIDRLRFFSKELGEPRFLIAITSVGSEPLEVCSC